MQRKSSKNTLAAKFCALMLCVLLFLAGCGNYSAPGSQPGGTPQASPTYGGYNVIHLLEKEIPLLSAPQKR